MGDASETARKRSDCTGRCSVDERCDEKGDDCADAGGDWLITRAAGGGGGGGVRAEAARSPEGLKPRLSTELTRDRACSDM